MSKQEILDIVRSDFDKNMQKKIERFYLESRDKFREGVSGKIVGKKVFTGKSGQCYNIVTYKHTVNECNLSTLSIFSYIIVNGIDDTLYFCFGVDYDKNDTGVIFGDDTEVSRYTNHAISRYGERIGKDYHGANGFLLYSIENPQSNPVVYDNDRIFVRVNNGAFVGNLVKGVNRINTFLTEDMLTKKQKQMYDIENIPEMAKGLMLMKRLKLINEKVDNGDITAEYYLLNANHIIEEANESFYKMIGYGKSDVKIMIKTRFCNAKMHEYTKKSRNTKLGISTCIMKMYSGICNPYSQVNLLHNVL